MIAVFFFYGLAFIILGIVCLIMPKDSDFLKIAPESRFLGIFALIHGVNEWLEMLILAVHPKTAFFQAAVDLFLPSSFIFLVIFGSRLILRVKPGLKWLRFSWLICLLVYFGVCLGKDVLILRIAARYFICFPGALLSGFGIFTILKKIRNDKIALSGIISLSAKIAGILLISYGFLSGLVVPKAAFFPASIINYQKFYSLFHLPVQFFRMLCALFLTVSFSGISFIFKLKNNRLILRGGIQRRITFMVTSAAFGVMLIGISTAYITGSIVVKKTIGAQYAQITQTLSMEVSFIIADLVNDVSTYVKRPLWLDLINACNLKYAGMADEAIKQVLIEMDKKWIEANPGSPLLEEYLGSRVSFSMQDLIKIRKNYAEIFITDRFGGLVAASGKTSDFYQADEEWWQEAYNSGKGNVYIEDLGQDLSSGLEMASTIAAPFLDKDGRVIGICKVVIDLEKLFITLNSFKIGESGYAVLISKEGAVLNHPWNSDFNKKLLSCVKEDEDIAVNNRKFQIIKDRRCFPEEIFVTSQEVGLSFLPQEKDYGWRVFVVNTSGDVLRPLYEFVWQIIILAILLVMVIIPIGYFLGRRLSSSIRKLHLATERVIEGDLDYRINIQTGDEVEQLADNFNNMILDINHKQKELIVAKDELEAFSIGLEKKVNQRTLELTQSQEAILNMLEDLTEAKEKLERYSRQLEDALKVKTRFTATVSHELRTPLTAIKEGVDIVLDGSAGTINEEQYAFLDIVKRNVDRLARLINDVLDFQKLEAGKTEFNLQYGDINEIIREVSSTMAPLAKSKGLEIALKADTNLPKARFDKDKIIQVLMNLVNNAIKFTEKGGIIIMSWLQENTVYVSVEDTGRGIKVEDLPRLFISFEQIVQDKEGARSGTGLGLAISKAIIEKQNGRIWAESEFGKGTKFIFTLPVG